MKILSKILSAVLSDQTLIMGLFKANKVITIIRYCLKMEDSKNDNLADN